MEADRAAITTSERLADGHGLRPDLRTALILGLPESSALTRFEGAYLAAEGTSRPWDVTPDGRRFVIIKAAPVNALASPEITVVQNWFEELRRLVPTN